MVKSSVYRYWQLDSILAHLMSNLLT
jgi:hypothetical protein